MNKLLFLCTGNYYRSRFAEEYFNHKAKAQGIEWEAFSKGLSQNMPNLNNPGSVSKHTITALHERKITGKNLRRFPLQVKENDFEEYDKIIAISKDEHLPMLESQFNHINTNVTYFEVGDLPLEEPKSALNKLVKLIDELINSINQDL